MILSICYTDYYIQKCPIIYTFITRMKISVMNAVVTEIKKKLNIGMIMDVFHLMRLRKMIKLMENIDNGVQQMGFYLFINIIIMTDLLMETFQRKRKELFCV